MSEAYINEAGHIYWFNSNNDFHREDGPAAEFPDGSSAPSWALDNVFMSFDDWCDTLEKSIVERTFLKLKYF